MKKLMFFFFLLINVVVFGQDFKIPEIKFQNKSETQNVYIDFLNLSDENSLIVKASYASYWYNGTISNFIVYQNDGTILKFNVFYPYEKNKQISIRRKAIKKRHLKYYWQFLFECVQRNEFQIDKSKLNITSKPVGNGMVEESHVNDAVDETFEIAQKTEYSAFSSYAAEIYIEKKFPGFEERQKLVDLMRKFEKLYEKY